MASRGNSLSRSPFGEEHDVDAFRIVRRLIRAHVWKYWPRLLATIVCMALVAGTTVAMARLMQPIIDDVFIAKDLTRQPPLASAGFTVFLIPGRDPLGQSVPRFPAGR